MPDVGVIMGSKSDWPTMRLTTEALDRLGVSWEAQVVSAHRTPQLLVSYAESAADRGLRIIVAGAGGAAHLPGMVASLTPLPVIGVPVRSKALSGMDSLLAIGEAGATNAGLLAARILGVSDPVVRERVAVYAAELRDAVLAAGDPSVES
jgi:5-(carboxyamino)imidazole ribonucleotide mutase